jgi:hypothetical protein
MEYVVTKTALRGRQPGAKFTEKELLDAGANIQKYLESGRLKRVDALSKAPTPAVKESPAIQAVKQEVQVQKEEPEAFVFKSDNNEQGDK